MVNSGKGLFIELVSGDVAFREKFRVSTHMSGEDIVVNDGFVLKNE